MSKDSTFIEPAAIASRKLMDGLMNIEAASPYPPAMKSVVTKKKKKKPEDPDAEPGAATPIELNNMNYLIEYNGNPVLWWGPENTYPQLLNEEARKCNSLQAGLKRIGDIMYGQGLYLCEDVFEDGEYKKKPVDDPDMVAWLKRIQYQKYFRKACQMLPRWGNVVPIYVFNEQNKLAYLYVKDTSLCRFEKPDPDSAIKKNIYISSQWKTRAIHFLLGNGVIPPELKVWVAKLPLLQEYDVVGQIQAGLELGTPIRVWAQWLKYDTDGLDYGMAPWHAAYENRWTGIASAIPMMKIRLSDHALTINYLIGVHENFWTSKYEDWDDDKKWTPDKRAEEVKKYQETIERCLSGKHNAYSSLMHSIFTNADGKEVPTLVITVLNNTLREGLNTIPDVQMADGQIYVSLGLDPSMIGAVVPGGSNGGGSGSPIREASLALNAWLKADRDLINEPFATLRDIEWPDGSKSHIDIGVKDYIIGTLDGRAAAAGSVHTPPN